MRKTVVAVAAIIVIVLGLIIVFAYPLREENRENTLTDQLSGQKWILKMLVKEGDMAIPLSDDIKITIQFDDEGKVNGTGGCNLFSGEYQAFGEYQIFVKSANGSEYQIGVGGRMSLEQTYMTRRACPDVPDLMKQETHFFTALGQVALFEVTSESLKMSSQDEQTILSFGLE